MFLIKLFKPQTLLSLLLSALTVYLLSAAIWAWQFIDELAVVALASPSEMISDQQRNQLLAVVDPKFSSHAGINFSPGQGRDTLTSEVGRIVLFEGPDVDGIGGQLQRFFRQVYFCCGPFEPGRYVLALVTNSKLSKSQQLEIYLANVYMGQFQGKPVYGFPSAALVYYRAHLAQLSETQWLSLVAMALEPNRFHPIEHPQVLAERVTRLERLLSGACVAKSLSDVEYSACDY